jgi:tetratricopeptide (TPR) repeat protein
MQAAGTLVTVALALMAAQNVADVRQLYDAGKYQEVVNATGDKPADNDNAARLQYLAAQSDSKMNNSDSAKRRYQRLAESGDKAWGSIGASSVQLLDKQLDQALESADQAVRAGGAKAEAHYQRGLVMMARRDYAEAANSFTKATEVDANFAAAQYYAGLANYRIKRIDLMTRNFETFVKLAPNAPERPEVESILRTVRGR